MLGPFLPRFFGFSALPLPRLQTFFTYFPPSTLSRAEMINFFESFSPFFPEAQPFVKDTRASLRLLLASFFPAFSSGACVFPHLSCLACETVRKFMDPFCVISCRCCFLNRRRKTKEFPLSSVWSSPAQEAERSEQGPADEFIGFSLFFLPSLALALNAL
jgi:hypothetical protein